MIKAVIIEDESLIARELQNKITTVAEDVKIIEILPSLKAAKKWFSQNAEPDLLFMDIQLSDGVSFELFDHFNLSCPVIFTTAYDEYAIRAFKVNSVDYLLKPIDNADLTKAIDKCRKMMEVSNSKIPSDLKELMQLFQSPQKEDLYKEKFLVHVRHTVIPVPTKTIACFYRDNLNYLVTFSGEKYILDYSTLEEVEELVNPKFFYRANRQYIIHVDSIQSMRSHDTQKLTVILKSPLKMETDISREKAPSFKKWLER